MPVEQFDLPVWFDLLATFAFALTGALVAIRRKYDLVGIFFIALISGLGGGLTRDGLLIQQGPSPILTDSRYIIVVVIAACVGILVRNRVHRFGRVIGTIDALGLGAYAAFGAQKSLVAGLGIPASILVGVINAGGGGILRDVITRQEPLAFKPGQFYLLAACLGSGLFVFLVSLNIVTPFHAAYFTILVVFLVRNLSIWLNWKTTSFESDESDKTASSP